jgi:ABC-type multidrug transport system fused ATPase/permease subunit
LIDGINIKEYSLSSLYENIGVIFQDFVKYEALVSENIGYGKVSKIKSKKDVHEASVKAEAWEFIKSLNKKYETHLGRTLKDEGTELSTGQWQKIALARAFFKDAQLLILDEPTAAVDAKAEYELFKKFEHLTRNKTTILISHRFSTVRMANRIIVIDKSKIIEQGTHKELLRKRGQYSKLFRLQAEGYQ